MTAFSSPTLIISPRPSPIINVANLIIGVDSTCGGVPEPLLKVGILCTDYSQLLKLKITGHLDLGFITKS